MFIEIRPIQNLHTFIENVSWFLNVRFDWLQIVCRQNVSNGFFVATRAINPAVDLI